MPLKNKRIKKSSIFVLSMLMLTGVFQGNVSALENNKLQNNEASVTQLTTKDLKKIEKKYGGKIKYKENKNLTTKEISKRFNKIDSTYRIGEPFSDKDAEFVVHYAVPKANSQKLTVTNKRITTTKSFKRTKTRYNVTITIKGSLRHTQKIINHSYGGYFYADITKGSNVESLKNVITHKAYGVIGDSGTYIGIVHASSISSKTSSSWKPNLRSGKRDLYIDNDKKYIAGPGLAYWRSNAYVLVTTKSGSTFTLHAWD